MDDKLRNLLAAYKLVLVGLGLAAVFWIVESIVLDVLVFREGSVAERLLLVSAPHEFWHRTVAVVIFVAAGIIAQRLVNKRRRVQERQFQLAAIVESSDEAIWGGTLDGTITSWNPAAEGLYGYSAEELIGSFASVLIPPDRRHELSESLEEVRQGRSVRLDETLRLTKGGEKVWVSVSWSPVRDLKGNTVGISTIARDVTEQKRTREELRRQKELYETLLNAQSELGEGFLVTEGRRIVYANEAYCKITGYTAEELKAMPSFIDALAVAEQRPLLSERLDRRLSGERVTEHYETAIVDKAGRRVEIEASLKMLRAEDVRVVSIVRDITERKGAEEELQARVRQQAAVAQLGQHALRETELSALLDEAAALVAETLNVEFCEVLELLPEGDALLLRSGVGWKQGYVGQVTAGADLSSQVGYTLLFSEPIVVEDLREERRFGGTPLLIEHGVSSGMSVVIQGRGRPYGVLGAHTGERRAFTADDTNFLRAVANVLAVAIERGRAEEALLGAQEGERRRIARDLHDLILQDLTYALQSLQEAQLRSENLGQGADLEQEIDALGRTIQGLRGAIYDLRQDDGRSFVRAAESLVELDRRMDPECDVEMTVEDGFPTELPEGVGTELLRIIQEALTNARRHSGCRQARVSLRTEAEEVLVEIVDDGCGFDPEADRGGVGLAGMRERALALGGRLEVESRPGAGTGVRFRASLPLLLGAGPEPPRPGEERGGETAEESGPSKRLLLVEDHVSFRQSLAYTLGSQPGFELVAQVGSLAGAREAIGELGGGIDIAVVDLFLADGTGTDLIRELHEAAPHATVLVLTASLDRQEYARAVEAGAAGVLHKSASIDSIVRALRRIGVGESLTPPSEVVELLRLALRQRERDEEAQTQLGLLTRREVEVLRLLAEGLEGKEIARRLQIAQKTEHSHMMSIFNKLGVHSRLQALVFAVRHGLVDIIPSDAAARKS